jgi:hypothetical protein
MAFNSYITLLFACHVNKIVIGKANGFASSRGHISGFAIDGLSQFISHRCYSTCACKELSQRCGPCHISSKRICKIQPSHRHPQLRTHITLSQAHLHPYARCTTCRDFSLLSLRLTLACRHSTICSWPNLLYSWLNRELLLYIFFTQEQHS